MGVFTWKQASADYEKKSAGSNTAGTTPPTSGMLSWKQAADEFDRYDEDGYKALGMQRMAQMQERYQAQKDRVSGMERLHADDTVNDWLNRYNRVIQGITRSEQKRNGGFTHDADSVYGAEIDALLSGYDGIKNHSEIRQYYDSLTELKKSLSAINESFSQFEDESAFDQYMAYWKDQEEKRNLDLDAYSREIAALEQQLEDYDPQIDWTDTNQRKQYDKGLQELEDEINRRKQYLAQAQRIQKKDDFSAVANPESEKYDAAFDSKSGYVSTEQDGKLQRMLSQYSMGYDDLTYEYINNQNGIRDTIKQKAGAYKKGETPFEAKGYDYMTEDEVGLYNYYYSMGGKASAEAYLDTIQEDLNRRKATGMYQQMEGKTGAELVFGVEAGLDQFKGGIKGAVRAVKGDHSYVAPSATQYASGMVREDLADDGIQLPSWLGGASLGQVGYDTITTAANMAPSLAIGMLNPTVGAAAMGVSAGGSAYQEALNEGYSVDQARGYGILSGASEVIMEKVLGGISAYGGNALGKFFTQNMKNADTALKRIAKELGGSMLSEFSEEYLQEVLTPVFKNLTLGTDEEVKLVSAEALYAGFLGAITGGVLEGPSAVARNATPAPSNATELANNATAVGEKSTPGEVTEQPAAVDDKMSATENAPTLEALSEKYGDRAADMRKTFMEGQDVQEYDRAFRMAYDMGKAGVNESYAQRSEATAYLSETQRSIAYNMGALDAQSDAGAQAAKNAAAANGKTGWRKGTVKGQGVKIADMSKAFNDPQRKAYKYLTNIAEVTGVDIVLYKSEADADGRYQDKEGSFKWSEDTIYIDINAGLESYKDAESMAKYTMMRVFDHEFTHFVEKWNPQEYTEFRKTVFETMTAGGANVEDLIDAVVAKSGGKLNYDQASREVIAEAMTDILPDSHFIEQLAQKNQNVFQQLLSKLKEFLTSIREHFASMGDSTKEAKALKKQMGETVSYMEEIVKKFDEVAVKAVENYQRTVAEDVAVSKEETTTETKSVESVTKEAVTGTEDTVSGTEDTVTETEESVTVSEESVIEPAEVASEVANVASEDASPAPAAQEYRSEHGYTIRPNEQYGSLEITFDSKPSQEVRDALKANKYRWNGKKGVWYGKTDQKTIVDALDKTYEAEPDVMDTVDGKAIRKELERRAVEGDPFVEMVLNDVEALSKGDNIAPAEPMQKDVYTDLSDRLNQFDRVDIGKLRFSIKANSEGGYVGSIVFVPANAGGVPIENSRGKLYSSFSMGFATRQEAVADLVNVAKNNNLLSTYQNKEDIVHGEESENRPDPGAVQQPDAPGEGTPRLLEGVEPQAVQPGSDGRRPVRTGEDHGTADAGSDGQSDAAGSEPARSTLDSVGGDLQQLPAVTAEPAAEQSQEERAEQLHEEVQQEIEKKSTETPKGGNFVIGDSLDLPNGTKSRTRANIEAIRIVKQLAAEGRYATAAEQEALSKYVGWGGLADAFGKPVSNRTTRKLEYEPVSGLEAEFQELREVLTEAEYKAARESTKNAHYTSIEVIKAMYAGLQHLGFTGGRMLEPSSGVGNFVGAMPADMTATVKSWTMVELDSITGQIAKYLYPNSDVRIQGFEETNIPDGYMDVAIGNVPFGNYGITDKHYPKTVTGSIHNYFFAKALDKVRPGGLTMFITSHYTMDGRDNAVRKYIMQRADLLGAIRLPNTAFAGNAGTSVVTDILILKKRDAKTEYTGEGFENVTWSNGASINEYFANHPDMILGETTMGRGLYGYEMTVNPYKDRGTLGDQIRKAMESIQAKMEYPATVSPEAANRQQANAKKRAQRLTVKNGVIHTQDEHGQLQKLEVDKDTADRITGMVGIRDAHTELCDALQQGASKKIINALRKKLNNQYDRFVDKYGYLNAPKNKAAIKAFADRYSILSLENYSPKTGKTPATATKADIFSKDTIAPNRTAAKADTVEEGLTISLNTVGTVDTAMIARLTGEPVESVTRQLIDQRLVFKDKDGNLIPAAQYLSGNVRAKLRMMEGLVGIDPDYKNNVEALKAVVPPTVEYTDIYVNPGATWVPTSVYEDFVGFILDRYNHQNWRTGKKDFQVEYVPETNEYKVSINDAYAKTSARNTQVWGESGKSFAQIFENMLNGRRTNVYMEGPDGKRVIDRVKTEAVAEKAEKLGEEFRKWLWEDEGRRAEMQELYNEAYNSLVTPKFSGESLTINGLNSAYSLRPHQKDAVARIINSGGNTLLAHRVGAGKTMEMAAAAMKLKQLGIIKKPMFVVPNNVVAQWGKEFKDYFPAANILLVGDEDMTPAERMTTINKIKNNDYDAVILAYTKFEKIQMTSAWRQRFYEEQIDSIMFAINAEKENQNGKGFTVKQLEAKRKQLEGKLKKLTDKEKDEDGAMFEDLGVDSLFVDEAHNFKNLEYSTRMNNVSGLGNADGSQRAFDLYTKVRYLQQLNGGRGIVFATATPVMNSMTEMYIMQRYLQPDTLKQLGIDNFDSWAKMFGEVVNTLEIAPSGSGYRLKQTFSKFKNVKALQQLFRSFTDVMTDIPGLKIPKMKGGKVQIVECEQGEFQKNYMAELAERAEKVKSVDPSEDNMLKITSDGRKISYSQRMIDPSMPYEESGKIYRCCENVWAVYQESAATRGTQMIFCDMATPKGKATTKTTTDTDTDEFGAVDQESAQLYEDIKARLIQMGIPAQEIAFIHDAKNDKQKAALSAKMNDGTIRVLLGSTGKMGVGLNAQVKAVAIHHLDAPWRPGDIEQRDGRVFRQRNQNASAYKFVYVTKGSFDSRLWDILERKQKFINQVMNGNDVGNEIEDTGEVTLSAAEVKAVASGNPLIAEQVALEKEISKLESLLQAHIAGVNRAKEMIVKDEQRIAMLTKRVQDAKTDIADRKDTYSDEKKFSIQIAGQTYTDKKDAGLALVAAAQAEAKECSYTTIGKFAGFSLRVVKTSEGITGVVAGAGNYGFKTYPLNPTYGMNHLISVVEGLDGQLTAWQNSLKEAQKDLTIQKNLASDPFQQAEKLKAKRSRYREVMDILNPPMEQNVAADDDQVQNRERTNTLTDREVLAIAANDLSTEDMTEAERGALEIFRDRLAKLDDLQEQRAQLGRTYKDQQFGQNVNREAAAQTLEKMHALDTRIKEANSRVLDVEEKTVLRDVLKKARKVVEQAQKEHDQEILQRWRDRRNNAVSIKKYQQRIAKDVKALSDWVIHPDNKDVVKHVPDVLKNAVIPFLTGIDFTSKRQLRGGSATKADAEFVKRLEKLQAALKTNIDETGLYSGYNDLPPQFMEKLQVFINAVKNLTASNTGEFVVNRMTSDELKALSEIVSTLKKLIQECNKFHYNSMYRHVWEAGDATIGKLSQYKDAKSRSKAGETVDNFLFWQQIRPAYAWERFGEGGKAIYDGLRRGQARLAFNTRKIIDFSEKTYSAEEVLAWEKEVKEIGLDDGSVIRVKTAQAMSFYELSKDKDALRHILGQGIRVATYHAGKEKISDTGHLMIIEDVNAVIDSLTDRQKEVADQLQQFMATQGAKWGNYVSVKRFGEELFGNPTYFPINSDGRHLQASTDEMPENASLYALLNMGFTKSRKENANNRIVLYSIFDVFANHMASMAQYNALSLPVLDALKWFNYQQKEDVTVTENGEETVKHTVKDSVRDELNRVYGVAEETRPGSGRRGYAENFITGILKAFNGTEAQGIPTDETGLSMRQRYNMAQVAFNLRVVAQQPLAITRAGMLIPYRSIIRGMKLQPAVIQKNIAEMQRYSGIAAWKELGFYDINISRGLTDLIKHKETWRDKVNEKGMKWAEKADRLTWAGIWSACKEEVVRRGTKPSDKGFFDAVSQLFEDVIYKTQVVDSVLTKNEYMRSKGFWARTTSSFMSEPVTNASMLIDAYDRLRMDQQKGMDFSQAWRRNKANIGRTAYVYGLGAAVLAAVTAVMDAFRDDDEYETFLEKWSEAFSGNPIDELNPLGKLPLVKEISEFVKELAAAGWKVDVYGQMSNLPYIDMAEQFIKGVEIISDKINGVDTNYTLYGGAYKLLQGVSGISGLPMAATTREIVTIWNNTVGRMAPSYKVKTYDAGEQSNIKFAYQDGYLTEEEAMNELLSKGLSDNEDEAYWLIRQWDSGSDSFSRYDAINQAIRSGGSIDEAMKELTAHGYTEKEVLSQVKTNIGKWYQDGTITKQQAMDMLKKYSGLNREDITRTVNKWSSKIVTGIAYDDIKEQFMSGNLSQSKAADMYVRYGGYSREDANATVAEWKFEKDYPDSKISYEIYQDWLTNGKNRGVTLEVYTDVSLFRKPVGVKTAKAQEDVAAYINRLPISTAQKDALWCCFWSESTLYKNAPWH